MTDLGVTLESVKPADLGSATRVTVDREATTIIGGEGDKAAYDIHRAVPTPGARPGGSARGRCPPLRHRCAAFIVGTVCSEGGSDDSGSRL